MLKQITIKELAEASGEDYLVISGLMKMLVKRGLAKEVGKRSVEGVRGKPSVIYEIPNEVELVLFEADAPVIEGENEAENLLEENQSPETLETIPTEQVAPVVATEIPAVQ